MILAKSQKGKRREIAKLEALFMEEKQRNKTLLHLCGEAEKRNTKWMHDFEMRNRECLKEMFSICLREARRFQYLANFVKDSVLPASKVITKMVNENDIYIQRLTLDPITIDASLTPSNLFPIETPGDPDYEVLLVEIHERLNHSQTQSAVASNDFNFQHPDISRPPPGFEPVPSFVEPSRTVDGAELPTKSVKTTRNSNPMEIFYKLVSKVQEVYPDMLADAVHDHLIRIKNVKGSLKGLTADDAISMISENIEKLDCVICFGSMDCQTNDQITVLPHCGHSFHSSCIRQWLSGKNECPCCRHVVDSYEEFPSLNKKTSRDRRRY